jgi:hypothetical protein
MIESYHDRTYEILKNLEYYEIDFLNPDDTYFDSEMCFHRNALIIECQSKVYEKLSPTCIEPSLLHGNSLYDFCMLENFTLWIQFIRQYFNIIFPLKIDHNYWKKKSFILKILIDESKTQIERIEKMKETYLMNEEEKIKLCLLESDVHDFMFELENYKKEYLKTFFLVFYHGQYTHKINCLDIRREIYKFL